MPDPSRDRRLKPHNGHIIAGTSVYWRVNKLEHFLCKYRRSLGCALKSGNTMRLIIGYFIFVAVLVVGLAGAGHQANAAEGDLAAPGAQQAQADVADA